MKILPWLSDEIISWTKMIHQQKPPHAILINGINGVGKSTLALQMAHIALCENLSETGVCHECSGCHLFKSRNHTDLTVITAEKSIIKVEQIRKLSRDIILSSTRNQYKIVIINKAEQMNKASANALLKTLEEPPKKVIIIITTSEMGRLLPTIKSRCIKLNISVPTNVQTSQWLQKTSGFDSNEITTSLLFTAGSPLLALEILNKNLITNFKSMLFDLNELILGSKEVAQISMLWIKSEFIENINFIIHYLKFCLLEITQLSTAQNQSLINPIQFNNTEKFESSMLDFIHQSHLFLNRQKTALKTDLLLEELLIDWKEKFSIN